jgi:tRNA pseudouridine38-40 synthase
MRHIRLLLQFDGSDYSGWQVQNEKRTVQGLIEKAVHKVTGEDLRATGASRTDAGVHALEQTASFKTGSSLDADVIRRALNANLPRDIRIMEASECPDDFHPRYSAVSKRYAYLITHSRTPSVFLKRYSWNLSYDLTGNLGNLREAAGYLRGEHDFSSFRASGCGSKTAVRKILDIEVSESSSIDFMTFSINAPVIKICITGNAFLRHMVRNIVGTLVDVGRGKALPSGIKAILESKDRGSAGITAPAHGLFLEKIDY